MFPTFISILDIQSWWEVPSVAHFCSLFRTAFNLLDFDIEDLEEALLTDGTEETSWLQELIVRLLSGCLANNEISTFNYQMFLRRLFRQKCQEHDRFNPFNTDIDFQFLPLRTKVEILQALCDFRLDADDVLDHLKNLEADSLRVEPLGHDANESAYWYFYGTRLYREDFTYRNNKKVKCVWQVVCFTEDDWCQLARKFSNATTKTEKQLYRTLAENFLPELPRLFQEKEILHRKRLLEWLPRRTSTRLDVKRQQIKESLVPPTNPPEVDEDSTKTVSDDRKDESKSRKKHKSGAKKKKDESGDKKRDLDEKRHAAEMAERRKQRDLRSLNRDKPGGKVAEAKSSGRTMPGATTVGRQTNNSLASATGQIVIQSVSNPNRKKLKTSQVFRQSEEDLQTGMYKILEAVKNHDDAWPFVDPVEEEYAPNYYTIIRRPMDLQRMEDKLDSGMYMSFGKFKQDFQLIVDNCRLYNGTDNEYTEMVDTLQQAFQRATDRYLDQISSSDEEIAVEFPDTVKDKGSPAVTVPPKRKLKEIPASISVKRKPTSLAHTADKRERSKSVESVDKKPENVSVKVTRSGKVQPPAVVKPTKQKNSVKPVKRGKKVENPKRSSRSTSLSPLSPRNLKPVEKHDSSPSVTSKAEVVESSDDDKTKKTKGKHKQWKEVFKDKKNEPETEKPVKPKDKNIKLKETIEKLKAKNDLSLSEDGVLRVKNKEEKRTDEVMKDTDRKSSGVTKTKPAKKDVNKKKKSEYDFEEEPSTKDSISENKKSGKKTTIAKKTVVKNIADIDALAAATEQTLKDINKWLEEAPRRSEFSSASNSPSHPAEDPDRNKPLKPVDKSLQPRSKDGKDVFKRRTKEPPKIQRRREIQRTIERLQPGKSKGNLIQNSNKPEEMFPLGPLSKLRDVKNSLVVKQDDSAPKLSLGTVLDSFGEQHNFNEGDADELKDIVEVNVKKDESVKAVDESEDLKNDEADVKTDKDVVSKPKEVPDKVVKSESKATPNLSAWFKAFGAPKVQATQKKKLETEDDKKDSLDADASKSVESKLEEPRKVSPEPEAGPLGQTTPRQRRGSTGSSVSERSSFSQDMDSSPRMTIDERIGTYPAPYPSPLHRSPASASPVMASPRQEDSQRSYPALNGSIRVGFYQDTVSTKSSPDKSCSPRDQPQSPYQQFPEHVYTAPNTVQGTNFPYSNPPSYYSQNSPTVYPTTNPSPVYGDRGNPPSYYDTTKSLTDQYNAKAPTPINRDAGFSPETSPGESQFQTQPQRSDKPALFPVKKRLYNDQEMEDQDVAMADQSSEFNENRSSLELGLMTGHQLNINSPVPNIQDTSASGYSRPDSRGAVLQLQTHAQMELDVNLQLPSSMRPMNFPVSATSTNIYNLQSPDNTYSSNVRQETDDRKLDLSNMNVNIGSSQYYSNRPASRSAQATGEHLPMRYPMGYRNEPQPNSMQTTEMLQVPQVSRTTTTSANIPPASFNSPPAPLGMGNLANLSHIVDRYQGDERLLPTPYYSTDKAYGTPPHMFATKTIPTSNPSNLPMFSQANVVGMAPAYRDSNYSRTLTELQNPVAMQQQQPQQPLQQPLEKKPGRKRKPKQQPQPVVTSEMLNSSNQQGFQSYAGLKNASEPTAISLKTTSVVPGSAFNFGPPPPTGLGLPTGIYNDNPAFLDEYRTSTNYYIAAAHRSSPDAGPDSKQPRSAHPQAPAASSFPFLGHPQPRTPGYPSLGAPFINPHQPPLMDPNSPLYQQYLHSAGVLHQGLLGPPAGYPPGYHPALSMRQPYDSMTRPSWL